MKTIILTCVIALTAGGTALAQSAASQGERATIALNMLESHSDGQYYHFAADGRYFSADVIKDGQSTHVLIDPDDGRITSQVTSTSQVTPMAQIAPTYQFTPEATKMSDPTR